MHIAVCVTQTHISQGYIFDRAAFATHFNEVAGANLVFDQQHNTGEVIFHQTLCTKTNGQTHHTGSGQHRGNGYTNGAQVNQSAEQQNDHIGHVFQHAHQGFDSFLIIQRFAACLHACTHAIDCCFYQAQHNQGNYDDQKKFCGLQTKVQQLGWFDVFE